MSNILTSLREANSIRQGVWDPENKVDLDWRYNELAGEVGEVCNDLKKLLRERLGIKGSRTTKDHLAKELADVVICGDLLLMTAGVDSVLVHSGVHWSQSRVITKPTQFGGLLAWQTGRLFEALETMNLETLRGQTMLRAGIVGLFNTVDAIAQAEDINMNLAVVEKFNETSANVGFAVRLSDDPAYIYGKAVGASEARIFHC